MMKQFAVYASALLIVLTPVLIVPGCSKSSDDDLVGNWVLSTDFGGSTRSEAVTFTVNNNVYVGTGYSSTKNYSDLWMYNPSTKYWVQLADMPTAAGTRYGAVAFTYGTDAYVGTGWDDDNRVYKSDFWKFSTSGNAWDNTAAASFGGGGRRDAIAFTVGSRAFVGTGYNDSYQYDIWEFTGSGWTQRSSMNGSKRSESTCVVYNNKVYVFSGNNNETALNDVQVYDPSADSWETKRRIYNYSDDDYDDDYAGIARFNAVSFVVGDKAYLATGTSGSLVSRVWEYDFVNDLWKEKTTFSGSPREGALAYVINGVGYITTGRSGSVSYENTYYFEPDAEDNDDDN